MGQITTHVLDTAQGKPGAGIQVQLYRLTDSPQLITTVQTNADGRTDQPLLGEDNFITGHYELIFKVGEYFQNSPLSVPNPGFLNEIPLRFHAGNDAHFHVPLLVSPWSYSTYRGS